MGNVLDKFRNRLVRLLFPPFERFFLVVVLVLGLSLCLAFSVPQAHWQTRGIVIWLIVAVGQLYQAGRMERDFLPIQPGGGLFYRVYRIADRVCFLFYLIWLIFLLIPESLLAGRVLRAVAWIFVCLFLAVLILRAAGDRKYRPKKPEE